MFFSLSKKIEKNFPCYFALGDLVLNVDLGWHRHEIDNCVFVYKGYIDGESFEHYLVNPTVRTGNFCVFRYDKSTNCCDILTDRYRAFTRWLDPEHFISNLYKTKNAVWANTQVQISKDFKLSLNYVDPIGDIVCDSISYSDAQTHIHGILQNKAQQFIKYYSSPDSLTLDNLVRLDKMRSAPSQAEVEQRQKAESMKQKQGKLNVPPPAGVVSAQSEPQVNEEDAFNLGLMQNRR